MSSSSSIPPFSNTPASSESRPKKRRSEEENPESKRVTRAAAKAMEETEGSKNAPSTGSRKAIKVPKEQAPRTMRAAARDIAKSNPAVASSSSKKRSSEQASLAGKRSQAETSNAADPDVLLKKLTEGVQDEYGRRCIREQLERIPEAERASVISAAAPLLAGVTDGYGRASIISLVRDIPRYDRMSVIQAAAPLLAGVTYGPGRVAIVGIMALFPEADRETVRANIALLIKIVDDQIFLGLLIPVLQRIPVAERRDVFATALPLMTGINIGHVQIIEAIGYVLQDKRPSVLNDAIPLMKDEDNGYRRAAIVGIMALFPEADRETVRANIALLIEGERNILFRSTGIIQAIRGIPIAERQGVLVLAVPLMAGTSADDGSRANIIEALGRIPTPERQAKVEALRRLVDGLASNHKHYCIQTASTFSLDTINAIAALPVDRRFFAVQEAHGGFSAESITSYTVTVSRDKIKNDPRAVMHDLVEKFKAGKMSTLNVAFLGEVGIDASGLSREFVTLLFDSLKSNLHFGECNNGLYRLTELQSDEEKALYRELGQLIQFCLNTEDYPIGMIFDVGVFAALSKLLQNENLDEISFERYFEAFTALHCNEDDKNKMRLIQTALEQQRSGVSDEVTGNPVQMIEESMKPYLEIARGIKSAPFTKITWQHVRDMNPEEFSTKFQGRFSKELVLSNLEFAGSIPAEKQEWIREWIQNAPDEKVKQFLFAMTGSNTVGRVALQIANRGENIYFHTCFNSVDMPLDKIENKELFVSLLESAISDPGKYSRS